MSAAAGAVEQRRRPIRRFLGGLVMRNGELEEGKVWANVGKGLCVWMVLKYADGLILHENVFAIIMLALIAPDLLKKLISMRAGVPVSGGYTRTEQHTEQNRTTTTNTKGEANVIAR